MALLETNERQTTEPSSTKDTATQRSPAWRSTFWQFLRYCLVGGSNTIIDLLMLNVLLWRSPTNNVLLLVVYNSVAYSSGAVTSFFLNKYWTFGRKQRTTAREVVRFAIILALEILSSNSLVWLAGKALQPWITNVTLWGNASKLAAVAGSALLSYAFMRFWIFARGSQHRPKQQLSPLVIQASLPQVVITGDLRLCVTELDAAHGPVTGSYSIETREMQEPLQIGGRGAGAASLGKGNIHCL